MDNMLGAIVGIGFTLILGLILFPLKDVILYPFGKNYKK